MMFLALLSSILSFFFLVQSSAAQQDHHYFVLKRFPYMNWAMLQPLDSQPYDYQQTEKGEREKRTPWDLLENTDAKRTSLKRLAILSARGFGRR